MFKKIFCLMLIVLFMASVSNAISLDDLINKLQSSQNKIKDMQADISTKMTTSMQGMPAMNQKGKIWIKGNKNKMEISSPMKQVTITNGDKMAVVNPVTGQKQVTDLSKIPGGSSQGGSSSMNFDEAKKKFDFTMKNVSGGYQITGIPKEKNQFMGKIEVFVDSSKMVPTKIKMISPQGEVLSDTSIEYKKVSGINVTYKTISKVNLPKGKMTMEMTYSNIKVNSGISDSVFDI